MNVTSAEVRRFGALVTRRLGLRLRELPDGRLAEVLLRRVAGSGRGPRGYLDRLAAAPERGEVRELAAELTVGETYFFRDAGQLRAFSEIALADRIRLRAERRELWLMSAGCASGEEPYTLAMLIHDALPDPDWRVRILGVDVNPAVLAKAATGRYQRWSMRATPDPARERWFQVHGRDIVLDPRIRASVAFEERNLAVDDPTFWWPGLYDVVFCRNVLMYFTPQMAGQVVARIARTLAPGGYLFLGHAEGLQPSLDDFELCHAENSFFYRRRGGSPLAPTPDPVPVPAVPQPPAPSGPAPGDGAAALLRAERYADALAALDGLPDGGTDLDSLVLRAVALTLTGRLAEAEQACGRLLEQHPGHAGGLHLLGICLDAAGNNSSAAGYHRRAAERDPTFALPRLHLGLLALRGGEQRTARAELRTALALLWREDDERLALYGGGFGRDALVALCRAQLDPIGGAA
jgi:chemotaxis protein methyltransferase CheR